MAQPSHFHSSSIALAVALALAAVPSSWAGDILRGGTPGASRVNAPAATSGNVTAQAAKAQSNATDALARTTAALQAVQSMQIAARKAALAGPSKLGVQLPVVPNGLAVNGLQVASGVPINLAAPTASENAALWTGAKLPTQTISGGKIKVTIVQTQSQALLNWKTFNIGKQTRVTFDQKAGGKDASKWIAFNQITDPSGNPTQILGSLDAVGQIYLINTNGIIFGGSSQVNTHNLTASTLPINTQLINSGLLNQQARDVQFLFAATLSDPSFLLPPDATYTLEKPVAPSSEIAIRFDNGTQVEKLSSELDYTLATDGAGKTVVHFTADGAAKIMTSPVTVSYTQATGDLLVQAGARLTSPTTPAKVGGRISLIGPNVTNDGTLSAADGQVILAAGREVGFAAHSQDDASLRGLDVFVGKVDAASGTVSHLGWIDIPRGNATLTGKTINQSSVITSSTSVSLNGSVDLLANYNAVANPSYDPTNISFGPAFVFVSSGAVTLGPKSVTRILPEWDSLETAVGTQLALPSRLKIQGLAIHLENQSSIFAPNANAVLTAGNWNYAAAESTLTRPTSDFINASGQVYFEPGATINVAGSSGVSVSVAQNILTLQLRGAELADSPVQRDGILRGITLNLDIRNRGEYNGGAWIGTPLGDATGFAGLIQRTVGELTTAGGSVTLKAGSSIVMQPGSTVDSSGGFIDFQGGLVETTRVTANGRLYDISQALPDRIYDGIYTGQSTFIAQKYGIAETFTNPLALKSSHYEAGYIQGASGGKIAITAPSMALDGTLIGQTVSSDLQRAHPAVGSELAITFQAQQTLPGYPGFSPTPPSITFATSSTLPLADAFALDTNETPLSLREERQKELVLSPELFTKDGFARLTISNGDGDIIVPTGLDFHGPVSGKLTFEAANITIGSDISAPGGALSFTAYNISPTIAATLETATPPAAEDSGLFNLAPGIKLNTAGLIVDERNPDFFNSPLTINGGSIAIKSFSANLPMGSALDVSGGVVVSSTGKRTDGTGGSLSVIAGRDPSTNAASVIGGTLVFDATLSGFGGSKGGSLTVQAQSIQIGGIHALANTLHLAPDFFNTGGFTSFTLTGIGSQNEKTGEFQPGLTVTANTVIQPVAKTWLATFDPSANDAARLVPILLPEGLRPSVSLSLNASGATDLEGLLLSQGDLVIEKGALIEVGPQASVAIKGKTVSLLGSIVAPGGRITVSADGKYPVSSTDATALTALPTLYLGADSLLSTKGMTVYTPDAYGRRTGSVLAGGNISIAGNIVADHGAILDVSGASGVLDLAIAAVDYHATRVENSSQPNVPFASGTTSALWNLRTVFTHVESDAGSIAFTGAQELFIDATLLGNAGGSTALGGSLDVTSGRFYSITDNLPTPQDTTLIVTQNDPTRPFVFYHPGESPLGSPVLDKEGVALAWTGHFSVNTFASSGMDSLTLQGNLQFQGNVSIDARRELSVASQGVLTGDGAVRLTAGHMTLGRTFGLPVAVGSEVAPFINPTNNAPYYIPPTYGPATLTVHASLIDIGDLTLQGFGETHLIAQNGDVRGTGTFDTAGDLTIRAGQVYPTTAGHFTIVAYDKTVLVASSNQGSNQVTLASATLPRDFQVGSKLLGSTVTVISGDVVTLRDGASASVSDSNQVFAPGFITFQRAGTTAIPLSAGGQLDVYASVIHQNGVLRAPLGIINLGRDESTATRLDLIAGVQVPISQELSLGKGSITSVSAGNLIIPYGISSNGTSFIDPFGNDISTSQIPAKNISLASQKLTISRGSTIDISGGGDLYAYRFNKGNGGSSDLLGWNFAGAWNASVLYSESSVVSYQGAYWMARANLTSDVAGQPPMAGDYWKKVQQRFAVIPSYQANHAPYAPFSNPEDPGYTTAGLNVGDRVWLGGSETLQEGTYTLLPARYALLPGAVLVTPQAGTTAFDYSISSFDGATQTTRQTGQTVGAFTLPEGANFVSGYRYNDISGTRKIDPTYTRFEVASNAVVRNRANYEDYLANSFLKETGQRLPSDAGHLILQASESMILEGRVLAQGQNATSRAGLIDIASSSDISISDHRKPVELEGILTLNAASLGSFGAESLLIGGIRTLTTDADGNTTAQVRVTTGSIVVDNARTPLVAPEIILAATDGITLAPRSKIYQSGNIQGVSDDLFIGSNDQSGSGDGVLLRVSSDPDAAITRLGYSSSSVPQLTIGAGSRLTGASLILDSTAGMSISPAARLQASSIALDSGKISVLLGNTTETPTGLVLTGSLLAQLRRTESLDLLSYSSIDTYGTGIFKTGGSLSLHAGEIRGFDTQGGEVVFAANDISLDNSAGAAHLPPSATTSGQLTFQVANIRVGENTLHLDQFASVALNARQSIVVSGQGGINAQGSLLATTPVVVAESGATQSFQAGGELRIQSSSGSKPGTLAASGLGASLTLTGSAVTVTSDIILPSGLLNLHASSSDIAIGGHLDVSGTAQRFFDVVRYTNAGGISLTADLGSVILGSSSLVSLDSFKNGGNAGSLSVSAAQGAFQLDGKISGTGKDKAGQFSLDARQIADISKLSFDLSSKGFTASQNFRLRTGDVLLGGKITATNFDLSADTGSITVQGVVDASGVTGGHISLISGSDLTIAPGSLLTVRGNEFSHAGKGGDIHLEAGAAINGVANSSALLDLQIGSRLDLGVDNFVAGSSSTPGASAYYGQFTGKLSLRAPRLGDDIQIAPIRSAVVGASAIVAEGFRIYDRTATGTLDNTLRTAINADANNYINTGGAAMRGKLLSKNADAVALDSLLVLTPGVEIINRTGSLTLGTTNSNNTADWNLAAFRYNTVLLDGRTSKAPGILTLRAAGDIVFYNAISDGFETSAYNARLLAANEVTPLNSQSWSYRFSSGSDMTAADSQRVLTLASLGGDTEDPADDVGSLRVGKNAGNASVPGGNSAQTSVALNNRFQVIRTGSGDIQIAAGRNVQLLNPFANIYTAGTRVLDATLGGTFDIPIPRLSNGDVGNLGAVQQGANATNTAQYTLAGGDVSILAQASILRQTKDINGNLVADSQKQMPTNWLNRRGAVDPVTGLFTQSRFNEIASTTWWVDFSNFFEGVGALGGGDVSLRAGQDIANVDAVIPTNARMAGKTTSGNVIAPALQNLVELGGGDLTVRTGGNIDAGVYYVEKGSGVLDAGGQITTNKTRSPSLGNLAPTPLYFSEATWLPTSLFLGKGSFVVNARGNLLIGPVSNPFLLPQGYNNTFWYKTYFSTYDPSNKVSIASLSGSVSLRERVSLPGVDEANVSIPILQAYYRNVLLLSTSPASVSAFQPWLRLAENDVTAFATSFSLTPSNMTAAAFSGDIDLAGGFNASPSAQGNVQLLAHGAINGLQISGTTSFSGGTATVWSSSSINVSDADPRSLISPATPFAYQNLQASRTARSANQSSSSFLQFFDQYLTESGSYSGLYSLNETKRSLHGDSLLHANDPEPVRLYATAGDISGLTLFSPKAARILAGNDITDIGLYLQNLSTSDISVVSAGRDLIAYDAGSLLRSAATAAGNYIAGTSISTNAIPDSESGDIQISGPGTLEVLAGRNLDLGSGATRIDGTGAGITSIGNSRNLNLPFDGARIIAGAGIPGPASLSNSGLDLATFQSDILTPQILARYLPEIAGAEKLTAAQFARLSAEQKATLSLDIFYRILRDSGRDRNDPSATTFGTYANGLAAIAALISNNATPGEITTQARDIRTKNGGNIDLLAPGGGLTLTTTNIGSSSIPPGIVTESGGNISVFTDGSTDIGISRIFTLRGGNIIIWSSHGDIAAGSSAKTVKSAPPTRVLIDAQSADVQTDLAGLATGGGIGVLATVADVAPGDVDLIAPTGVVDAGDAGIRSSGNLNIAAVAILNASNIQVAGTSAGVPTVIAPTVNLAGIAQASTAAGAGAQAASTATRQNQTGNQQEELPSIITVEVLGYGG